MKNTKEEDITIQPPDLDAMKTILEGAEIEYEEDVRDGNAPILTLDNGVVMRFGDNRELLTLEVDV